MKPKTITILYWVTTILFSLAILSTCIPNEEGYNLITGLLRYPDYFVNYIAVVKVLGVAGILISGFPRVKEWAYAGLFFDMISATYSFYAVDALNADSWIMLIFFGLGIASYVFYHKKINTAKA
jgi:DoxX-like family